MVTPEDMLGAGLRTVRVQEQILSMTLLIALLRTHVDRVLTLDPRLTPELETVRTDLDKVDETLQALIETTGVLLQHDAGIEL